jgi:hypothetical protein
MRNKAVIASATDQTFVDLMPDLIRQGGLRRSRFLPF